MISLEAALQLKRAGLAWQPALHDFFAIPERGMDERCFVIADLLATIELRQGLPVVAFQGASEWALDSLAISEAVWLPREEQLRGLLEAALLEDGRSETLLSGSLNGYTCTVRRRGETFAYAAHDASEAYAAALLAMLQNP